MADELVLNATQIARLAGVRRGTAAAWRRRRVTSPPRPAAPRMERSYDRAEVEAWLAAAGLLELDPGPRVWREVSHARRAAPCAKPSRAPRRRPRGGATGKSCRQNVPGTLAWLSRARSMTWARRRSAATCSTGTPRRPASRHPGPGRRVHDQPRRAGDGATVLDPASGTGELLAAALARGAVRVLAQDASAVTAELTRARLFPGPGQSAEVAVGDALSADAFAGIEADAVICRPPVPASGPRAAVAWARYALAHLKPGGRAVLALPPSAAAAPSGRQARAQLLRQGVLRTVIALPVAGGPALRSAAPVGPGAARREGRTRPAGPVRDRRAEARAAWTTRPLPPRGRCPRPAGGRSRAASRSPVTPAPSGKARGLLRRRPQREVVRHRVADLLDDTGVLDESERLDETVDLTPARVRAHFSAWHREKDKESARRRGNVRPANPAATFMHSRLGRSLISRDIDAVAEILQRLDWLGDLGEEREEVEPQRGLPAGPWRTATVPELARLGLLRYRRAGTAPPNFSAPATSSSPPP